ncbi:hypothetical protein DASC09_051680 [Saccharomycopsis crataegensis]|uniref:F-box domain-containing protein n=1 Tax=Saccharomycopsis crataegensis TaxID=43959 RepID=A0AAV5QUM8_9ASCO|nr:hypothetical protein DASC09_051680 [Saccharomycopsis crataegensis]
MPNELIFRIFGRLDAYELLPVMRILPSKNRLYECALFLLLHKVEIYYDGKNTKPECFEDIFKTIYKYQNQSDGSQNNYSKPHVWIRYNNLPKISKYESAIKKIIIHKAENSFCTRRPLISKGKSKIIQCFLNRCTNVKVIENRCGLDVDYPKSTETLKIFMEDEAKSFYMRTYGRFIIDLSKISLPTKIKQLYLKSVRFIFDITACFPTLSHLEIECSVIRNPKKLRIDRHWFPSLVTLVLRCDTMYSDPLEIDLQTPKTGNTYHNNANSVDSNSTTFLKGFQEIEHLTIIKCGDSMIPKSLQNYKALKTIDFSWNNTFRISNSFKYLVNLVSLNLEYNDIRKIENLGGLLNLEWLSLKDNEIENIEGLNLPKLKYLNISQNRLRAIDNLQSLKVLEELDISRSYYLKSIVGLLTVVETLVTLHCYSLPWRNFSDTDLSRLSKIKTIKSDSLMPQFPLT